ncbi:MAG: helix-turn-helix transcriptional regulator [Planctomycetes bacterium]|nr:helix-turn-helix transcriptional regulator [Planctomycetota bacterium]
MVPTQSVERALTIPADCPLEECLQLLAGAWTLKILWYLRDGPRRFGELRRLLSGVSAKVLTTRLRELEERGLVTRVVQPTSPPSVEYSLAPLGHEIQPVLCSIAEVGKKLQKKRERAPKANSRAIAARG